jgi:hypothetical protein
MRFSPLVAALALAALPFSLPAEVRPGDSLDHVFATLGHPKGELTFYGARILLYDRGEVKLRDGVVYESNVVSNEELRRRAEADAIATERARIAAAERRAELQAEGERVRQQKLSDGYFLSQSASEQAAYWRSFQARYPMVSVGYELAAAERQANEEASIRMARLEQERRLAEMEYRVSEAERRARQAEYDARRARSVSYTETVYYPTPTVIYTRPVVRYNPIVVPCPPVYQPIVVPVAPCPPPQTGVTLI